MSADGWSAHMSWPLWFANVESSTTSLTICRYVYSLISMLVSVGLSYLFVMRAVLQTLLSFVVAILQLFVYLSIFFYLAHFFSNSVNWNLEAVSIFAQMRDQTIFTSFSPESLLFCKLFRFCSLVYNFNALWLDPCCTHHSAHSVVAVARWQ